MTTKLTITKLETLGYSNKDAILMLTALTRICPYDMIQERKWFECKGKMTLAIRTTRAVSKPIAMPYIEDMLKKAKTNRLIKPTMWENLKSSFEKVEKHESNS